MDGMLLVAEMGETRKGELRRAREMLDQARIRILGIVLNKMRSQDSGYSYRYGDANGGHTVALEEWLGTLACGASRRRSARGAGGDTHACRRSGPTQRVLRQARADLPGRPSPPSEPARRRPRSATTGGMGMTSGRSPAGGGGHNPPSRRAVYDQRTYGSVGAGAGNRPGYPRRPRGAKLPHPPRSRQQPRH